MPYTDWIPAIDATIENKETYNILEFGLGEGTKYLLDNFRHVHSYEIVDDAEENNMYWLNKTKKDFEEYANWSIDIHQYNEIDFIDYSDTLSEKFTQHIDSIFEKNNYDVVFIDGAGHNRGLIADYILNKQQPKYVIIHDTNYAFVVDGYDRIKLPNNYSVLTFPEGEGTQIFIKTT